MLFDEAVEKYVVILNHHKWICELVKSLWRPILQYLSKLKIYMSLVQQLHLWELTLLIYLNITEIICI